MYDIRDVIKKLVELDSAQGIEKVAVRQENITKVLNIRSVYSENGIAIIETGGWEDAPENPSEKISQEIPVEKDSMESEISDSKEDKSEEVEPERKRGRRKKEAESEEA